VLYWSCRKYNKEGKAMNKSTRECTLDTLHNARLAALRRIRGWQRLISEERAGMYVLDLRIAEVEQEVNA